MDVTRPSLRRIALGFMLPSYDEKARAEREFRRAAWRPRPSNHKAIPSVEWKDGASKAMIR